MAYIDPTPTEPIPVLPDADAAAEAAESSRRAESVSMTAATLMARASRAGASRSRATGSAPMGKSGGTAPVGGTRVGGTTTLDESREPTVLDQSRGPRRLDESSGSVEHWSGPLGEAQGSAADELAESSGNFPADDPASGDPISAQRSVRPSWQLIVVTLLIVVPFVFIAWQLTSSDGGSGSGSGQLTFPIDGRTTAVIHIDSGADSIVVGTAELGDDLAVVTTPGGQDGGVRPQARLDGDQLRVSTDDIGDAKAGSPVQINVQLAAGVRWDVVVNEGAKQILLALGSGEVNLVELRGGADLADVTLPKPVGEMAIRIPTGQATAALHVPANIPVKATFGSGAGRAVVDGVPQQGIAPGTTIFGANGEEGYLAAKDRYLVDVLAGVGTLSLDRT
jgi:hypothetical protein